MRKLFYMLMIVPFVATISTNTIDFKKELTAISSTFSPAPDKSAVESVDDVINFVDIKVYKDVNMTKVKEILPAFSKLNIKRMVNQQGSDIIFQLADEGYIVTNQSNLTQGKVMQTDKTLYSNNETNIYSQPKSDSKYIYSKFTSPAQIKIKQVLINQYGEFTPYIFKGKKVWLKVDDLNDNDMRMKKVETLLTSKYNDPKYSIYVKQVDSDYSVGINQDSKMYSASLTKLPILYEVQKRINNGDLSLNLSYKYIDDVNKGKISFKPEGAGFLPKTADGKEYTLLDLINRTAMNSDNVASNILSYYICQPDILLVNQDTDSLTGVTWDLKERNASSHMAGIMMERIYKEQGQVYQALKTTQFDDERIPKKLPKDLTIAHKIGDAYDFHHDVALVEAVIPYVLSIETRGDVPLDNISNISKDIYDILK